MILICSHVKQQRLKISLLLAFTLDECSLTPVAISFTRVENTLTGNKNTMILCNLLMLCMCATSGHRSSDL